MAQENGGTELVSFDDFDGELEEHWQEAKGRKVVDKSGGEVGTVEGLYIWKEPSTVHLLKVSGEDHSFLLPVHAATTVTEEAVEVEQSKETMMASPEFDEEGVPDEETRRAAYAHFGYPDPLDLGRG